MSRCGYSDDLGEGQLAMWRGQVASATRGERGQRLLKDLLSALDEMPKKRLIANDLVLGGEVCLLGAGALKRGITDIDKINTEDDYHHHVLAEKFDVAPCLIQEIEYINDEANYTSETPEHRYERARRWLVENIKTDAPSSPAPTQTS